MFRPRSDSWLLARVASEQPLGPGARVLELCAGPAFAGIMAARGRAELTTVDVSRRAQLCAWVNGRLNGVPASLGNVSGTYTVGRFRGLADWHWVGSRFVDITTGIALPSYNYFNFGLSYLFPENGVTLDIRLLNAFQSEGLEEGNPRLLTSGTNPIFLARPILPRRLTVGLRYDFGANGAQASPDSTTAAPAPSQSKSQH